MRTLIAIALLIAVSLAQYGEPAPPAPAQYGGAPPAAPATCQLNPRSNDECARIAKDNKNCQDCVTSNCKGCQKVFIKYCTQPQRANSVEECLARANEADCPGHTVEDCHNHARQGLAAQCAEQACEGGDAPAGPRDVVVPVEPALPPPVVIPAPVPAGTCTKTQASKLKINGEGQTCSERKALKEQVNALKAKVDCILAAFEGKIPTLADKLTEKTVVEIKAAEAKTAEKQAEVAAAPKAVEKAVEAQYQAAKAVVKEAVAREAEAQHEVKKLEDAGAKPEVIQFAKEVYAATDKVVKADAAKAIEVAKKVVEARKVVTPGYGQKVVVKAHSKKVKARSHKGGYKVKAASRRRAAGHSKKGHSKGRRGGYGASKGRSRRGRGGRKGHSGKGHSRRGAYGASKGRRGGSKGHSAHKGRSAGHGGRSVKKAGNGGGYGGNTRTAPKPKTAY